MQKVVSAQIGLCLFVLAVCAQEQPYCNNRYERLCQGKGPHVACQFPYRGVGEACENYTAIIFTNNLKKFVLHYINRRRQRIAAGHERVRGGARLPKPELMMMVQWDRELAFLAQRLADQCQFVHDDCRATVRYPYAGQTVGEVRWRKTGSLENGARRVIAKVFDAWWGERRRVLPKQMISPFMLTSRGAVWGHFSQLTVWTLRAMGCGAVHHGSTRPRLLLVCDFSHTNMLGQRTISPGPLAPCPMSTVRIPQSPYPLLCAPIRDVQEIKEGRRRDQDEDSEVDEDDDEEEEFEEPTELHKKTPPTMAPEVVYSTRPWPDRPVRPIQDISTEENSDFSQNRDDLESAEDRVLKENNEDIVYRESESMNQRQRQMAMESQTVIQDGHRLGMDGGIISQKYGQREVARHRLNFKAQMNAKDSDRYTDMDSQINRQKYERRMEMDNSPKYIKKEDKDIASIKRYDLSIRNQPEEPNQKDNSNIKNYVKPIYNEDEFQRPVRPIHEHKSEFTKAIPIIRPLQDDLIETGLRPVRPINELDQNPNRPVIPLVKEEDDDDDDNQDDFSDKKNSKKSKFIVRATEQELEEDRVTMVSVIYRDKSPGEVKKGLEQELSSKSRARVHVKYKSSDARNNDADVRNNNSQRGSNTRNWDQETANVNARGPHSDNRYRESNTGNIYADRRNEERDFRNRDSDINHKESGNKHRYEYETTRNRGQDERNKAVHKVDNYRRFELMSKAEYKSRNGYTRNFDENQRMVNEWIKERKHEELKQRVIPLQKDPKKARNQVTTVVVYRPTSLFSISTEPFIRNRFKQTRIRPNRPGAIALLQSTPKNLLIRRQSKASLLLDKDDEEQLYHDTGFKLSTTR